MAGFLASTRTFLEDVREQMQKVTWPDRAQLKSSTIVIMIFVAILAFIIFVMDIGVSTVLNTIRSLAGG
jgi:preprotein translocase subunit SecE